MESASSCGSLRCSSKKNNSDAKKRVNKIIPERTVSRTDQSTDRTPDSTERTYTPPLNLTLYGSPAPRCFQRPSASKVRKPMQPPNTPNEVPKPRKPLELPIDKIMLLNERLEMSKSEKIKIELSARQIKLSDDEDAPKSDNCDFFKKLPSDFSSCDDFDKHPGLLTSSTIDLSIDLSSVTNSDHDTETSSDELENISPVYAAHVSSKCQIESESTSTCSQSPVRYVWSKNGHYNGEESVRSYESTLTSYPWTRTTRRSTESSSGPYTDISNDYSDRAREVENNSPTCPRARSADLIHVYVNTVNNHNKLSKYFRPCRTCKEACCVCPDVVPDTSRTFYLRPNSVTSEKLESDENKNEDCLKSNRSKTEQTTEMKEEVKSEVRRPDSRCSDFSNFLHERCSLRSEKQSQNTQSSFSGSNTSGCDFDAVFDSGMSTLPLDENNDSDASCLMEANQKGLLSKRQISLSVMQLATAAQCARILANSLESVLEIVSNDFPVPEEKNLIEFENTYVEDLISSLDVLKSNFPPVTQKKEKSNRDRMKNPDGDPKMGSPYRSEESKWFNFENIDNNYHFDRNCPSCCKNSDGLGEKGSCEGDLIDQKQTFFFEDNFDEYFKNFENNVNGNGNHQ